MRYATFDWLPRGKVCFTLVNIGTSFAFALMTSRAFSQKVGKLVFELKLVTDNLSLYLNYHILCSSTTVYSVLAGNFMVQKFCRIGQMTKSLNINFIKLTKLYSLKIFYCACSIWCIQLLVHIPAKSWRSSQCS